MISFYSHCSKGALIVGASLLVACGGGSSSSTPVVPPTPPPDTSAPAVTLEASKTTVEGGETVVLTAMANDNVDTQVTPSVSCDGGILVSDFLKTAETEESATITCTGSATDAAGNRGEASVFLNVEPTLMKVELFGDSAELTPGEVAILDITGVELTQSEYEAELNGEQITLFVRDGIAALPIPVSAEPGQARLTVTLDGERDYSFEFDIQQALTIADPQQYVSDSFDSVITLYDDILSRYSNMLTPAQIDALATEREKAVATRDDLGSYTAAQVEEVALFLQANSLDADGFAVISSALGRTKPWNKTLPGCGEASLDFTLGMAKVGILFTMNGFALAANPLLGLAVTALVYPKALEVLEEQVVPAIDDIGSKCLLPFRDMIIEKFQDSRSEKPLNNVPVYRNSESRLTFRDGEPERVAVSGRRVFDGEAQTALDNYLPRLDRILDSLSEFLPNNFVQFLARFRDDEIQDVPSAQWVISNISRDDIEISKDGDALTVTFTGQETPASNIDFSFDLADGEGEPTTVQAQLNILPEADDVMVEVRAGETVTAEFQTRGADSVRLVSNPSLGNVELNDSGFSYTAFEGPPGSDRFSYEAVNSTGVSDPATVFIMIDAAPVIARDMAITVFPGQIITFELDAENATRFGVNGTADNFPDTDFAPEVAFNEDGTVTIRIAEDATGQDRLIYTAFNDFGDKANGTVTITVDETSTYRMEASLSGSPDNVCANPFFDINEAGSYSFVSGTNRDASFTIIQESTGEYSINVPPLWQLVIGEPIDRIFTSELDEEGRPDFEFGRFVDRSFNGVPMTYSNYIGISFVDDTNTLRAYSDFTATRLSDGKTICSREVRANNFFDD